MTELAPGRVLASRFELRRLLGRGGMGQVWLAMDSELDEQLAVKVLEPALAADQAMLALLRHECRQARRLVHRNIVRIYDFHVDESLAFISMEFVEGGELGQYRDRRPEEILDKIIPLTSALGYAHAHGIVHRDLKPSNVLIDREGMPRLVDFGVAGLLQGETGIRVTGGGSPLSMSPQQRKGLPPSPADDAFALGILIYELIAGFPPTVEIGGPPPGPMRSRMNYAVPRRLQSVVSRLLVPEASSRPADMAGIGEELKAAVEEMRNRTTPPEVEDVSESVETEEIVPVSRPSAVSEPPARPSSSRQGLPWVLWAAFGVLAIALVAVVFLLPGYVERRQAGQPATAPVAAPDVESEELERLSAIKAEADQVAARFEMLAADLESRGVGEWGAADFRDARALVETGRKAYDSVQYGTARDAWAQAVAVLEGLRERGEELLRAALDRASQALREGRRVAAESAFSEALMLDPDNAAAQAGLSRAANIERVFSLYSEGLQLEEEGQLESARDRFREAAALDPEYPGPQEAIARVEASMVDRRYTRAMSDGYSALAEGRYDQAIANFEQAARIRPQAPEPGEGITRAREEKRVASIADARSKAQTLEAREQWQEAASVYRAILADDGTVAFAQAGSRRARARAELDSRLQGFLDDPERLYSDKVRAAAEAALGEASRIPDPGPRLTRQISQMEMLLAEAVRPVRVVLESDNLTEIVLYRVGRLGTFDRYQLELRPGTYTVIGTRKGFRDVRQQFTVRPGEPAGPFMVRCEEPI